MKKSVCFPNYDQQIKENVEITFTSASRDLMMFFFNYYFYLKIKFYAFESLKQSQSHPTQIIKILR